MDSIFKITNKLGCGITITGLELDNDEYLDSGSTVVSTRMYTYEQSITINILETINSKQESEFNQYLIVPHSLNYIDECDMITNKDGLYTVYHIIIPNNLWLEYVLQASKNSLEIYSYIYYYDLNTCKLMLYSNGNSREADVKEILEINPLSDAKPGEKTTTIIKSGKSMFLTCNLMNCYYNMAQDLLTNLPQRCLEKNIDINITLNRDVLWMAINTIKYLLEKGLYFEALRILENVTYCNLICNSNNTKISSNDCGCIKR